MDQVFDVICIGAGATGLYLGYRMSRDNPDKSLLIIDKLSRVGGMVDSVPLEDVNYQAEGCAQRFLSTQSTVVELFREFNLKATEIPSMTYSTGGYEVRDELFSRGLQQDDYKRSNLDVLVNLPNIEKGSYSNMYMIDQVSGYGFGTHLMNVSTLYTKISLTDPEVKQYYPDGGWKVLLNELANKIRERYQILLDTEVINVYQLDEGYRIETSNGMYLCRHLVFTGDRTQLNLLGGESNSVRQAKILLNENIGTYLTYLKMYVKIKTPWWSETDIGTVMNDIGPINQLILISSDTLCIYNDSSNADLLFYLVPERYRSTGIHNIEWIAASAMPRLSKFINKYVRRLYERLDQLNGVSTFDIEQIAFKYTKEASLTYGPLSITPSNLSRQLNSHDNLHLISDSYHTTQGWIQYCFDCVDENYQRIVS